MTVQLDDDVTFDDLLKAAEEADKANNNGEDVEKSKEKSKKKK